MSVSVGSWYIQRKGQTTTIKLPLEMPTTPIISLSMMCSGAAKSLII